MTVEAVFMSWARYFMIWHWFNTPFIDAPIYIYATCTPAKGSRSPPWPGLDRRKYPRYSWFLLYTTQMKPNKHMGTHLGHSLSLSLSLSLSTRVCVCLSLSPCKWRDSTVHHRKACTYITLWPTTRQTHVQHSHWGQRKAPRKPIRR
jgi:hypothetical protein